MAADLTLRIGLLVSTTGPYATVGRAMRDGARLAEAELAEALPHLRIEIVEADPGGSDAVYAATARRMLGQDGIRHVVGCYTSSSRKEVLPLFEKFDGLLWYPSHYEGFETSENVVYTGAAPNQHIVPLARHMLGRHGGRVWCVGSNYIWAWENNKILREAVAAYGGQVLAERYFPVGETDFGTVIDQILESRPDFVFNTMIGDSAYAFYRGLRAAAARRGLDQPAALPIASCSLAEPELLEIGPAACDGHVSSSVYFESVASSRNAAFLEAWRRHSPQSGPCCADAEAAYFTLYLLVQAIQRAGTSDIAAVLGTLAEIRLAAPQGQVWVDAQNRHAWLTPRIGVSNRAGGFDIIYAAPAPVRPDPYLVWTDPARLPGRDEAAPRPALRLVQ